jgi:hypothetical protein
LLAFKSGRGLKESIFGQTLTRFLAQYVIKFMDGSTAGTWQSEASARGAIRPRVYFARAIDGQDLAVTKALVVAVREELNQAGLALVDPIDNEPPLPGGPDGHNTSVADAYRAVVDHDLSVLKTCDAALMDLTSPGRGYIGCVCELTYAYLWQIPCVVYLGSLDGRRPWLHYHATAVVASRTEAIAQLRRMLI